MMWSWWRRWVNGVGVMGRSGERRRGGDVSLWRLCRTEATERGDAETGTWITGGTVVRLGNSTGLYDFELAERNGVRMMMIDGFAYGDGSDVVCREEKVCEVDLVKERRRR
ncbi:hypothetical protein M0R45_019277 [Rubus argutus]|uniref:Uncharacterized protein n=1 Tax=Rubus argutus TaxID=59490 RepID=A0AAW1X4Y3_RUBAR